MAVTSGLGPPRAVQCGNQEQKNHKYYRPFKDEEKNIPKVQALNGWQSGRDYEGGLHSTERRSGPRTALYSVAIEPEGAYIFYPVLLVFFTRSSL